MTGCSRADAEFGRSSFPRRTFAEGRTNGPTSGKSDDFCCIVRRRICEHSDPRRGPEKSSNLRDIMRSRFCIGLYWEFQRVAIGPRAIRLFYFRPFQAFNQRTGFLRHISSMLIAFHKPYHVLSQFTPDGSPNRPLAEFGFPKHVYPIGRLDADSEGLLLLSDEREWNARLLEPRHAHEREYWVQVERIPTLESLQQLESGLLIQGRRTLPCHARLPEPQPVVPPRDPPIRFRKNVPDCWIILELIEGKNRQVRRMTAAIGHPTLRLIRTRIGHLTLGELPTGEWKILTAKERKLAAGGRV